MSLNKYFPYSSWRKYQKKIAEAVRDSIRGESILLLEAPTGVGKTSAVLAGALVALDELPDCLIFFTARTKNQAMAPFRELRLLRRRGINVLYSLFRSKREMCFLESARYMDYDEFLEFCKLERGKGCKYSASVAKLPPEELFEYCFIARSPVDFIEKCRGDELCPYEVARRLVALKAKVVIGAYPYVFDPKVQEAFFSMTGISLNQVVLVIDEAHNLSSSLSNMLSLKLSLRLIRLGRREALKYRFYDLVKDYDRLLAFYRAISKRIGDKRSILIEIDDLLTAVRSIQTFEREASALSLKKSRDEKMPKSKCYSRVVAKFLRALIEFRRGYVLSAKREEGEVTLEYRCINPASRLEKLFSNVKSAILMSATLQPKNFMVDILGIPDNRVRELRVGEIFPRENRLVIVASDVTSRYVERSEEMFKKMASYIDSAFRASPMKKAVLVVFPSYEIMKPLKRLVEEKPTVIEDEDTRIEDVIFQVRSVPKALVFAVAGGKIVEGIEIKSRGESLISTVVIAGIPYPEPDIFSNKLKELISMKYSNRSLGWEYAYAIPAAMKIKQAAGRAIRSEK
ncbi:MAG TPA: ATP-dependent DNA helicase, partial [Thermoprotei archaeon]|nr:ATP-dependent DNA helicase [Thermoprotei archaeon]